MSTTVPSWVYTVEPPADEEPWLWTCGDCGLELRRDEIPAHRADEDRRSAGVIVWLLGAVAVALLAAGLYLIVTGGR